MDWRPWPWCWQFSASLACRDTLGVAACASPYALMASLRDSLLRCHVLLDELPEVVVDVAAHHIEMLGPGVAGSGAPVGDHRDRFIEDVSLDDALCPAGSPHELIHCLALQADNALAIDFAQCSSWRVRWFSCGEKLEITSEDLMPRHDVREKITGIPTMINHNAEV